MLKCIKLFNTYDGEHNYGEGEHNFDKYKYPNELFYNYFLSKKEHRKLKLEKLNDRI